jgi:hypothetical protein
MRTTWSKYIIILLFAVAFLAACGQEELPLPTEQAPVAKSTAIADAYSGENDHLFRSMTITQTG